MPLKTKDDERMNPALARWVATFFRVGDFPFAPGTAASAVGLVMAYYCRSNIWLYLGVLILVTVLGFMTSGIVEKAMGKKDPGCVVIDEVSGIMISFLLIPVFSWPVMVAGFFLFRAFDMFKIYPEDKFEAMGGAKGIMLDDMMAGVYTNIVLQIGIRWADGVHYRIV
ncbi:MAG: phosphatidylglycerophosphatase A [Candidatus Omnitrophica bacterium]|nr:phosphatidylglycerophosphatase A [Candidatus Omnitrophota bacterium]